jgi:Tol biopolymer transport system component/predicted Ser/Thr protein kinase
MHVAADSQPDRSVIISAAMDPESLGHYRILQPLGSGGMGQVYLADDTTLHRKVALKVLLDDVAADPERRERFRREARAIAALSHPNIVTIHSVEEDGSRLFLTMEYVDGKPLTDAIPRDGLPLDKLLAIAIPLADAVAAAHQAGIVHRDLKPANVMLTTDGRVKVLDFGLAHLREEASVQAATMTAHLTGEGRILGTAAYMSPEQAEGRVVDSRSDLFSLGIVLFEMATGQRPFTGDTNISIISAILKDSPKPISSIRPDVPRELARIIKRALQKDPEQRYQTAKDLRNDLQMLKAESDSGELAASASPAGARPRTGSARSFLIAAAAVAVIAGVAAAWWLFGVRRDGQVPQAQWTALTDFADAATQPSLSPDGRMLAFIRGADTFVGPGDVYVKLLPSGIPVQLTHDGLPKMDPRFSPDGTEIAYTAIDSKFNWNTFIVPVFGGREPRLLLANAASLSWTGDHQYLFSEIRTGVHMAVVTSGEARADKRDIYIPPTEDGMAHRSQVSPDGRYVLISAEMDMSHMLPCRVVPADGHDRGITVGPVDSQCFYGVWTPDGQWMILTANAGSGTHLYRQRFPEGAPEQITFGPTSEAGTAVAPDGRSVVTSAGAGHDTVWIHDSTGDRLVISEGAPTNPQFSRDGTRLFFMDMNRSGTSASAEGVLSAYDIQQRRVDTLLGGIAIAEYDLSRDGKLLAFTRNKGRDPQIWVAPVDGSQPPRLVIAGPARFPDLAPDGFLYYGKVEGGTVTPWRAGIDGSNPKRVGDFTGLVGGMSPDGSWRAEMHFRTRGSNFRIYLRHVPDDKLIELACGLCEVHWPDDRHFAIVSILANMGGVAYLFPASPKSEVPDGLEDAADLERFAVEHGARIVRRSAIFAPDTDTYAYTNFVAQRNLYRIPLR